MKTSSELTYIKTLSESMSGPLKEEKDQMRLYKERELTPGKCVTAG